MRLYLYVSPSISNSYVPVCLVFACDIHAHTGIYALIWEFIFACIVRNICTFSWSEPVFACIQTNICTFHDLYRHIQAHMHFSRSSYLPVFACILVCICLYLPISVSLMRQQRARDSIVILSRSRSRTGKGIHSWRRASPPRRRRRGSNFKSNRVKRHTPRRKDALFKQRVWAAFRAPLAPRTRRRRRRARSVSSWSSNLCLTTLDLVQPHWDVTIFLYLPTNIIKHFVRSHSAHDNTNENSECS